jgi:hypothetical protein
MLKVGRFAPDHPEHMALWTLIAAAAGICWICMLALGWMLCRAAQRGDEGSSSGSVVPLTPERLWSAAQRR